MKKSESDYLEWLQCAEQDRTMINRAMEAPPQYESAAFLAQQCAEKILKGYLIHGGWTLRKIHDLTDLLADCVRFDQSPLTADCGILTPFAISSRYPGIVVSRSECEAAIAAAERIRAEILKRLPSTNA